MIRMFAVVAMALFALTLRADKVKVIFDTDMYTDYDDVGALAMLHALADAGECEIVAVGCNTYGDGNKSVAVCEIVNSYYGRGDIVVGCSRKGGERGAGRRGYGLPEKYPQWVKHPVSSDAPDAVAVYRKALEKEPDGSVVLCSVGFLNNVAELLRVDRTLVERKVKSWVCMACAYPNGKEYNSMTDAAASEYAFSNWPKTVPIIWTDFQYGRYCFAGRAIAELSVEGSPVKDAFAAMLTPRGKIVKDKTWDQMDGHPAWDQTAVLIAVRGWEPYFSLQHGGYRMVGKDGENVWTDDAKSINGRVDEKTGFTRADVGKVIDELMCRTPKARIDRSR